MKLNINNTIELPIDSFRECLENDTVTNKPFIYLEIKRYSNDKTMLQTLKPFLMPESISSLVILKDEQVVYDFADAYKSVSRAYTLYDEELKQIVTVISLGE